jgi:site-specific DNA recombinase
VRANTALKKKGIWMGGVVPLGYRVESRALHVVEEHAEFVRDLVVGSCLAMGSFRQK